ncbi:GAF and ANTAR domain-containing protein [Streptomyces thermolineatus]|uniref:GAF and ANTAR domain-containing protein n=1 Tax=Streptomyces thermolineatus TaxID=44033 RepID=A0ABN3KQ69_9ACTN
MDENVTRARRDQRLAAAFVELGDTLSDDFDAPRFLRRLAGRCVELLDVSAAGLMLTDRRGGLQTATSGEQSWLVELFEQDDHEGPCLDCLRGASPIPPVGLAEAAGRWPRFAARAGAGGVRSTYAVPIRLRGEVIGALNLFCDSPGRRPEGELELAQALADAAAIGLLNRRAVARAELLASQLQSALNSRVVVEQAKGVLAERWQVDVGEAFTALRRHARSHNERLSEVARRVVDGSLDTSLLRRHADRPS